MLACLQLHGSLRGCASSIATGGGNAVLRAGVACAQLWGENWQDRRQLTELGRGAQKRQASGTGDRDGCIATPQCVVSQLRRLLHWSACSTTGAALVPPQPPSRCTITPPPKSPYFNSFPAHLSELARPPLGTARTAWRPRRPLQAAAWAPAPAPRHWLRARPPPRPPPPPPHRCCRRCSAAPQLAPGTQRGATTGAEGLGRRSPIPLLAGAGAGAPEGSIARWQRPHPSE